MKLFLSGLILLLLVVGVGVDIDTQAMELQDQAFERAMIAFGLAKSLNGVISLIQGTELSLSPAGIGVTLSIGEILDPLNDMVERFSWVMLVASISLGIQKFLLLFSGKMALQILFVVSGLGALGMIWYKKLNHNLFFSYTLKMFAFFVLIRFGAVVFLYLSHFTYTGLLENSYDNSLQVVEQTQDELETYQQKNTQEIETKEEGFFSKIKEQYNRSVETFNFTKQINNLEKSTDAAFENIITLITIFVLQSLLLPLLYIWFLIYSIKFIFKRELNYDTIINLYNARY